MFLRKNTKSTKTEKQLRKLLYRTTKAADSSNHAEEQQQQREEQIEMHDSGGEEADAGEVENGTVEHGEHIPKNVHMDRKKHMTFSRDVLAPTQFTAYLSTMVLKSFSVERDTAAAASDRKTRINVLLTLLERLQHQHYTREQQLLGLQVTSATGNVVTDAAIRTVLEFFKVNVQRSINAEKARPVWTFLAKGVPLRDVSALEMREFDLIVQCLVRCAVLMAQHRDDVGIGRDVVKTQQQQMMNAMMQDDAISAGISHQRKKNKNKSKRLGEMMSQSIASDVIGVFSTLPNRVKYSQCVAEALHELLVHCGSHVRSKHVDAAEELARAGMFFLKDSIDLVSDSTKSQERMATVFAWCLALIPRFKQKREERQQELIAQLVHSLDYLLDMCFALVKDRKTILDGSFAQSLTKKSNSSTSDKQEIDITSTIFRHSFKKGFSTLQGYEFMRLFKAVSDCLQRCLTQETPFVFSFDVATTFACLTKAFLLDKSLMAQSTTSQPLLSQSFYQIIPYIHQSCLRTISCMVVSCGNHLMPLVNSILDLLVMNLKDCSTQPISLPTLQLYSEITRCVSIICQTYGAGVCMRLSHRVLPMLLEQLQLQYYGSFRTMVSEREKRVASLDSYSERLMNKKTKKKRRREEAERVLQEYHISQKEYEILLEMTIHTLATINDMMVACRVFVTSGRDMMETLSCVADMIVFLMSHLDEWFEQRKKSILHNNTHPVNEIQPVIERMFDCLLSCLLATSSVNAQSPFIVQATNLFRKGASSYLPQLVSKCSMALNVLESHLHPRSAPLYIPSADTVHAMFLNNITHKTKLTTGFSSPVFVPIISTNSQKMQSYAMDDDEGEGGDYSGDLKVASEKMTTKEKGQKKKDNVEDAGQISISKATALNTDNITLETSSKDVSENDDNEDMADAPMFQKEGSQEEMTERNSETFFNEMEDDEISADLHEDSEDELGDIVIDDNSGGGMDNDEEFDKDNDNDNDDDDDDDDDLDELENFSF